MVVGRKMAALSDLAQQVRLVKEMPEVMGEAAGEVAAAAVVLEQPEQPPLLLVLEALEETVCKLPSAARQHIMQAVAVAAKIRLMLQEAEPVDLVAGVEADLVQHQEVLAPWRVRLTLVAVVVAGVMEALQIATAQMVGQE